MKRGLTVILAALVLLLTGGDGAYGNISVLSIADYVNISALSIADAESLYLVPGSADVKELDRSTRDTVIFKITKEGEVVEVKYTDNTGINASTKGLNPTAIYHANDEYIVIVFNNWYACLVSKQTGAVYWPDKGMNVVARKYFSNSLPFLSDGKNNIYYYSGIAPNPDKDEELYRIDVSNPEKMSVRPLTAPNDQDVTSFVVDAAGNVVYSHSNGFRFAFAGGGFTPYKFRGRPLIWTAPDGKLYYLGMDQVYGEATGESGYPIYRLDIEGQKVTETEYGKMNKDFFYINCYYLTSGDRAYILETDGRLHEVYNPEGKPRLVEGVPAFRPVEAVAQSEEELFIAGESDGQPRVIRVNPVTGDWSDLTPGDDKVYNMVYAGGRLMVNAERYSDGAIIIGELDGTGSIKVIDEKSNRKVFYWTRIR